MPLLRRLSSFWRNLREKDRVDRELDEEIHAYLGMLIDSKVAAGSDPAEARRAALVEVGGVDQVKEKVVEVRMGYHLEILWQDIRSGLRWMRRSPGFTAVAIISLALGLIGALALTRVLSTLLFGVSATDPATFLGVAALLATVALIACYLPARKATQVDPVIALKYD